MNITASNPLWFREAEFSGLLRGESARLTACVNTRGVIALVPHLLLIVAGTAMFGATMGLWRGGLMAWYVAIKFPLVILLTTMGTALLNAMLAPLVGVNLGFRQSLLATLVSYDIAAAILGALAPLTLFMVWSLPPFETWTPADQNIYNITKLVYVGGIAFAGMAANVRLYQWLAQLESGVRPARRVLLAWLSANLLLGSQLTWILRPFIGSPNLPIEFLRSNAFDSGFFDNIYQVIRLMFINP